MNQSVDSVFLHHFKEDTAVMFVLMIITILCLIYFWPQISKGLQALFLTSGLNSLLNNRAIQIILPGFCGIYYISIDLWMGKWEWLTNNEAFHSLFSASLFTISLTFLTLKGVAGYLLQERQKRFVDYVENISNLTSKLVKSKLERYKKNAKGLSKNTDSFKKLSQPEVQINLILTELEQILKEMFELSDDQLSITIARKLPEEDKWYFSHENNPDWTRSKVGKLVKEGGSAISHCVETGESCFFPDKKAASYSNKFFMSDRDKRFGNGSAFCFPSVTKTPTYEAKYVLSIVTYGKLLCNKADVDESNAIKTILTDASRRLDLELTVLAILRWKYGESKT